MNESHIFNFFSSIVIPQNASESDEEKLDQLHSQFRSYLWGKVGLNNRLKKILFYDYGKDLELILFQFILFPSTQHVKQLQPVENYRKKEKAIGLNTFIYDNFFEKNERERQKFLIQSMLVCLENLEMKINRNKLDTNIIRLQSDMMSTLA